MFILGYNYVLFMISYLQFLYNNVMAGHLPGILCAIAHGGSTNFANKEEESKTPILLAIEQVSNLSISLPLSFSLILSSSNSFLSLFLKHNLTFYLSLSLLPSSTGQLCPNRIPLPKWCQAVDHRRPRSDLPPLCCLEGRGQPCHDAAQEGRQT